MVDTPTMKRFRFPLTRLLRLRAHEERAARRALADALAEVARIERRMLAIDADLAALAAEDPTARAGRALVEALANGLSGERRHLGGKLALAEQTLARARAVYQQKRTDVEALVRLRRRRRDEWLTTVQREEQAELDEAARMRFAARQREVAR
jgi:flagellar export protein FliJ